MSDERLREMVNLHDRIQDMVGGIDPKKIRERAEQHRGRNKAALLAALEGKPKAFLEQLQNKFGGAVTEPGAVPPSNWDQMDFGQKAAYRAGQQSVLPIVENILITDTEERNV